MEWITSPEAWISLFTLTVLEIVLGIDNIVFISILAGKLPASEQEKARKVGLMLALGTRILLLLSVAWLSRLTTPLFTIASHGVSGRDIILLVGGLFLLAKSTHEIHEKLEGEDGSATKRMTPTYMSVIIQIMVLDIVFSLDSVVTAIGMAKHVPVMVIAVCLSVLFMLFFSGYISRFIDKHPTIKMLALSFLLLIGCSLVAEAFHKEIPKGYIYFAMAFSIGVEMINLNLRKKRSPVELHQPYR